MTENQLSTSDLASDAQGVNPGFGANTAQTDLSDTRPAFAFDSKQDSTGGQAVQSPTLKDKAFTRLQSEADNRKGVVSDQLKQVSGALRSMGGQGGGDAPQWMSGGVDKITQFIDRIADQVETRNTSELVSDIRGFAKTNPAVFLGAAALAGFAAVRIFAATGDRR